MPNVRNGNKGGFEPGLVKEQYILKMKSFNISYRKGLTCHGVRMNPLEHRQVLCGSKLWYH